MNTTNPFTYTLNPPILGPLPLPVPAFQTHTALLPPNDSLKERVLSRTFCPPLPGPLFPPAFSISLHIILHPVSFAPSPKIAVAGVPKDQVQGMPSPPWMSAHLAGQWPLCPGNSPSRASVFCLSLSSLSHMPPPYLDQPHSVSGLSGAWSSLSLSTFSLNLMHP